jgi:acyl dehydratase
MNAYHYNELDIGQKETFSVEITESMMELFLKLSGDCNPLHLDGQYAKELGFPSKVVYGMLTASFYSTLAGVYLPGKFCLLQEVGIKFTKPVFIGDVLTVSGTVTAKTDVFLRLTISARITNQKNQVVSRAVVKAGVLNGK